MGAAGHEAGYSREMGEHRLAFRLLADLVRAGVAVGAVAALVGIPSFGIGVRCLLVGFVLMVPRATGHVAAPLDFAFGATLLVALWTSMTGWYTITPILWLVHAAATGVTAVVLYPVLVAVGVLGAPSGRSRRIRVVRTTTVIGLVVGGAWEAYRWFESIALPVIGTHVGAGVAIHLLVDAAGALVAGLVLAALCGPRELLVAGWGEPAHGGRSSDPAHGCGRVVLSGPAPDRGERAGSPPGGAAGHRDDHEAVAERDHRRAEPSVDIGRPGKRARGPAEAGLSTPSRCGRRPSAGRQA